MYTMIEQVALNQVPFLISEQSPLSLILSLLFFLVFSFRHFPCKSFSLFSSITQADYATFSKVCLQQFSFTISVTPHRKKVSRNLSLSLSLSLFSLFLLSFSLSSLSLLSFSSFLATLSLLGIVTQPIKIWMHSKQSKNFVAMLGSKFQFREPPPSSC